MNTQYEWREKNWKKWKERKKKEKKNVLYSQHIDLSRTYILIEFIFFYRFYVVSGSITWWWVWNIYELISSKLDTLTDDYYYNCDGHS